MRAIVFTQPILFAAATVLLATFVAKKSVAGDKQPTDLPFSFEQASGSPLKVKNAFMEVPEQLSGVTRWSASTSSLQARLYLALQKLHDAQEEIDHESSSRMVDDLAPEQSAHPSHLIRDENGISIDDGRTRVSCQSIEDTTNPLYRCSFELESSQLKWNGFRQSAAHRLFLALEQLTYPTPLEGLSVRFEQNGRVIRLNDSETASMIACQSRKGHQPGTGAETRCLIRFMP